MNCIICKHYSACPVNTTQDWQDWMLERQGKHGVSCTAFVPVLISPAQYQERTGLAYPDQGPVWVKKAAGVFGWGKWQLKEHEKAGRHKSVLCAFGDLLPTIDWKEEI